MNAASKRLNQTQRKKKHLGEFQVFGFEITAGLQATAARADIDAMLNALIGMLDAHGLEFCGSAEKGAFEGFVASAARYGIVGDSDREAVRAWLASQPLLENATVGPLRDAWHSWNI